MKSILFETILMESRASSGNAGSKQAIGQVARGGGGTNYGVSIYGNLDVFLEDIEVRVRKQMEERPAYFNDDLTVRFAKNGTDKKGKKYTNLRFKFTVSESLLEKYGEITEDLASKIRNKVAQAINAGLSNYCDEFGNHYLVIVPRETEINHFSYGPYTGEFTIVCKVYQETHAGERNEVVKNEKVPFYHYPKNKS